MYQVTALRIRKSPFSSSHQLMRLQSMYNAENLQNHKEGSQNPFRLLNNNQQNMHLRSSRERSKPLPELLIEPRKSQATICKLPSCHYRHKKVASKSSFFFIVGQIFIVPLQIDLKDSSV